MWKEVKGYEGYYEVSDTGQVRSVRRTIIDSSMKRRTLQGNVMKQTLSKDNKREGYGYYVVNLRKDGQSKVVQVHRLVAENFLENTYNLPTVNHKDGNKQNNDVSNLEWATYRENNIHALNNGLRKPRGNKIAQYTLKGDLVSIYKSACEASRVTGIGRGSISHCLNGRVTQAGGFAWIKIEKCNDYLIDESTVDDELPSEVQERINSEDIVYADGNIWAT